jgi:hypothetical protein
MNKLGREPMLFQMSHLSFDHARRTLNLMVIRSACLEVDGKTPEQISLGDVFGYMDSLGYLILLLSLAATLAAGFLFGMIVLSMWPEPSVIGTAVTHFPIICGIPGLSVGWILWCSLFRIKRWLTS